MTDESTGNKKLRFQCKRGGLIMATILVMWFIVHCSYTIYFGLHDTLHPADAIVVLGNTVNQDGSLSARLESRLKRAISIIPVVQPQFIIVSGGTGKEGFSEAKKMQEYLIKNGVAKDKIFVDEKGDNTFLTAQNSVILMEKYHLSSVVIVSQFFHLLRTQQAFSQCGWPSTYHAHAQFFALRDIYSLVREFFAFYKYYFVGCK